MKYEHPYEGTKPDGSKKSTTKLTDLPLQCVTEPDSMLSLLAWLCDRLMEPEVSLLRSVPKNPNRSQIVKTIVPVSATAVRHSEGTLDLMIPKVRRGGYVPLFVNQRKRSEVALIQGVQGAFINGVSTRKMERLAKRLGIESLSRSQVSQMAKEMGEQVEAFRHRPLGDKRYPVLWTDVLFVKVHCSSRVVRMTILFICGINEAGEREVLDARSKLEESCETDRLKQCAATAGTIISDARRLIAAVRGNFSGVSWQ